MGDKPVPFGPPTPAVSEAIDTFLDTCVRCDCAGRDIQVSARRIQQEVNSRAINVFPKYFPTNPLSPNIDRIFKGRWESGSSAEGLPASVVGDFDFMYSWISWPEVVLTSNPDHSVTYQAGYLIATQSNRNNPAYLTLEALPSVTLNPNFQQYIMDGSNVVSSESFMNGIQQVNYKRQGPAFQQPSTLPTDAVPCLVSPSWPPCALDFLTRPRQYDWPSRKLIDKIKNAGCLVVAVGHPQSDNKDNEWRWSFSVAEKELIFHMSDAMHGCMYVLKAIKKHQWGCTDPDKPTTFCSYFIKTACLWVCETEPHNANVMELCRKVLAWLIFWYRTNTLPHYFIPNQNLIGHLSKDMCKEVYDWLLYTRSDLWYIVLSTDIVLGITNDMGIVLTGRPISTRNLVKTLCLQRTQQLLKEKEHRLGQMFQIQRLIATVKYRYFTLWDIFPKAVYTWDGNISKPLSHMSIIH